MHLLFLHLQTICCLQLLLFSYLQIYQKLVYRHIFCNNFHYSSIPDTSNSQITQSETPQTPSPNLIVSTLLYMHHLLRKYQSMQKQSSSTYIILLAHTHTILRKVFNGFLMAGNGKKRKKMSVLMRYL